MFRFSNFNFLVDYAHNPAGWRRRFLTKSSSGLTKTCAAKPPVSLSVFLQKGIGDSQKPVKIISCEKAAIRYAVANARPGDLIVDCVRPLPTPSDG